ncbi:MAG: hypothetical protein A2V81_04180 [Candidatus Abawacabacteria bacterium RBG_16_42_10]|uniref:Uncharacterized protein n=1 Tax=Candidatus Abawacabacteria bacterium RBG_16_42_10 TaxID=1817814 RepID=A0A1F4XIK0_9BACT|nr:MAG: hypothetical protein A2V81_04180 [Candidatus Abawacabacteria bacterium RBG_16_42_10]
MQILLMSGGGGTRLWPLSTEEKPKQFQAIFDKRSLLRTTFERILPLTTSEQIWVSGNTKHDALLKQELPEIPTKNIILEPAKRDNAAAICLNQLLMAKQEVPLDEVVVMLPTDHLITNEEEFRALVTIGESFLQKNLDFLVTIGITPTYPETGFGYIHKAATVLHQENDFSVNSIHRFVEKPNKEQAEKYVSSKEYLWNSGIYMWTLGQMLTWFQSFLPNIYQPLSDNLHRFEEIYSTLPATSLDYGISEKLEDIAVIPDHNLEWSDVGDFRALGEHMSDNIATLDVKNSYIRNDTSVPMKVIGVENIVIVNSPNGLLICDRDRAQEVKKLSSS